MLLILKNDFVGIILWWASALLVTERIKLEEKHNLTVRRLICCILFLTIKAFCHNASQKVNINPTKAVKMLIFYNLKWKARKIRNVHSHTLVTKILGCTSMKKVTSPYGVSFNQRGWSLLLPSSSTWFDAVPFQAQREGWGNRLYINDLII